MTHVRHRCPVCGRVCRLGVSTGRPLGKPRLDRCKRGHRMAETVRTTPNGRRWCRECAKQRARERAADRAGAAIVERWFPRAKGL